MLTIHDDLFKKYGQVLSVDTKEIVDYLKHTPLPIEGNIYVASDSKFESLTSVKMIEKTYFGEPMEAGYCNGHNKMMNCVEYHGCIEINIASDDCTLFLGTLNDIVDGRIDSNRLVEFLVKKGEAILMYPGTLHFSPCIINQTPFHMGVFLTKGTNTPLKDKTSDSKLWQKNKWLIAHKDTKQASMGAYIGIDGENRVVSLAK